MIVIRPQSEGKLLTNVVTLFYRWGTLFFLVAHYFSVFHISRHWIRPKEHAQGTTVTFIESTNRFNYSLLLPQTLRYLLLFSWEAAAVVPHHSWQRYQNHLSCHFLLIIQERICLSKSSFQGESHGKHNPSKMPFTGVKSPGRGHSSVSRLRAEVPTRLRAITQSCHLFIPTMHFWTLPSLSHPLLPLISIVFYGFTSICNTVTIRSACHAPHYLIRKQIQKG